MPGLIVFGRTGHAKCEHLTVTDMVGNKSVQPIVLEPEEWRPNRAETGLLRRLMYLPDQLQQYFGEDLI